MGEELEKNVARQPAEPAPAEAAVTLAARTIGTDGRGSGHACSANDWPDDPVPCRICKMLLNGRLMYIDHLKTRRHRKNMAKQREHGAS